MKTTFCFLSLVYKRQAIYIQINDHKNEIWSAYLMDKFYTWRDTTQQAALACGTGLTQTFSILSIQTNYVLAECNNTNNKNWMTLQHSITTQGLVAKSLSGSEDIEQTDTVTPA